MPRASPTKTARSPVSGTDHIGVGRPAAYTFACAAVSSKIGPGSGPVKPANRAPSPIPISSAISSMSPSPPNGDGPLAAITVARAPVWLSPAYATPLNTQRCGSGQGSQSGTCERYTTEASTAGLGARIGYTDPCSSQVHSSAPDPGECSGSRSTGSSARFSGTVSGIGRAKSSGTTGNRADGSPGARTRLPHRGQLGSPFIG